MTGKYFSLALASGVKNPLETTVVLNLKSNTSVKIPALYTNDRAKLKIVKGAASLNATAGDGQHCEIIHKGVTDIKFVVPKFDVNPNELEVHMHRVESSSKLLVETLANLGGLFGLKEIRIHHVIPHTHGPLPAKDGSIDLFLYSSPAQRPRKIKCFKQIDGMEIPDVRGCLPTILEPCPYRGGVLCEGDVPVGQYVDNSLYLFYHPETLEERGEHYQHYTAWVVLRLISLWFFTEDVRQKPDLIPIDLQSVESETKRAVSVIRSERGEKISELRKEISELERKLFEKRREQHMLSSLNKRGFESEAPSLCYDSHDRMHQDLTAVMKNPIVRNAEFLSGVGVLVRLRPLVIEHEHAFYNIGRLSCLFRYDGEIDIWADESAHPEGIPHPHIDLTQGICYGNVKDAIALAMAEYHIADAITLTLSWLEFGYADDNAGLHNISEWPLAEKEAN